MHPEGSTTCVRLPVVKKWIVSVGQARRQSPQLMQASSSMRTAISVRPGGAGVGERRCPPLRFLGEERTDLG